MSFFGGGDLSVTGTATSRHARPPSGKGRRTFSASHGGSTKSHIFNVADSPRDTQKQSFAAKSPSYYGNSPASSVHVTPEAPRPGGVINPSGQTLNEQVSN